MGRRHGSSSPRVVALDLPLRLLDIGRWFKSLLLLAGLIRRSEPSSFRPVVTSDYRSIPLVFARCFMSSLWLVAYGRYVVSSMPSWVCVPSTYQSFYFAASAFYVLFDSQELGK